jgi:hypothetical protein
MIQYNRYVNGDAVAWNGHKATFLGYYSSYDDDNMCCRVRFDGDSREVIVRAIDIAYWHEDMEYYQRLRDKIAVELYLKKCGKLGDAINQADTVVDELRRRKYGCL